MNIFPIRTGRQEVDSFDSSNESAVPDPWSIRHLVLQLSQSTYEARFIELRPIIFGNAHPNPHHAGTSLP